MTRQDQMLKWLCYALGLFPIWVLHTLVLPRYPIFHTIPNLLPLTVAAVGVLEGTAAGAGFGIAVGLVWALGAPGSYGVPVLGMALAGMLSGAVIQYGLKQNFFCYFLCSAGTLAMVAGVQVLARFLARVAPAGLLTEVAGREFLYSLVWTPLVYLIFRLVFDKAGGEKLAQ